MIPEALLKPVKCLRRHQRDRGEFFPIHAACVFARYWYQSMPADRVAQWLAASKPGHCGEADPDDPGDCHNGTSGAWHVRASAARQLVLAATACLQRCLSCNRCQYVSLSQTIKQCTWHHACPAPDAAATGGFRWGAFVGAPPKRRRGRGRGRGSKQYGGGGGSSACIAPQHDRMSVQKMAAMVRCLQDQKPATTALDQLMRTHLWLSHPSTLADGTQCRPLQAQPEAQQSERTLKCLRVAGRALWTQRGPVDSPAGPECGRRWISSPEARCLLAGRDVLFMGNSVTRRQMYTVLDLLAGSRANRQRSTGKLQTISLGDRPTLADGAGARAWEAEVNESWVWDVASKSNLDGASSGFHAAQLVTIDLHTGEHRFALPHRLCGVTDAFSTFAAGRFAQWRSPPPESIIGSGWRSSKWASREWRPLVTFGLRLHGRDAIASAAVDLGGGAGNAAERAVCDQLGSPDLSWAGAYDAGWVGPPERLVLRSNEEMGLRPGTHGSGTHRRGRLTSRIGRAIRMQMNRHFGEQASLWLANVSVQVVLRRGDAEVDVWVYFPTYHGEREVMNGFCEDKACQCTSPPMLAECATRRHPECMNPQRHLCKPFPKGSAAFVEHARSFASLIGGGSGGSGGAKALG